MWIDLLIFCTFVLTCEVVDVVLIVVRLETGQAWCRFLKSR
jgi:hypothetical protein